MQRLNSVANSINYSAVGLSIEGGSNPTQEQAVLDSGQTQAPPSTTPPVQDERAILSQLVEKYLNLPNFIGSPADAVEYIKQNQYIEPFPFLKALLAAILEKKINVESAYELFSFLSADRLIQMGDDTDKYEKAKLQFYLFAGKQKSSLAMFRLAELYLKGEGGTVKSAELAFSFCKRAVSNEYAPVHPEAHFMMGLFYEQGFQTEKNVDQAIVHYQAAADRVPRAYLKLSECYSQKTISTEDDEVRKLSYELHQAYFNQAVEAKVPEALYQSGLFLVRDPIESESQKGFNYIKEASDNLNSDANFWLGDYYYQGNEESRAFALPYFERAYNLNHQGVTGILGDIYFEGRIIERDLEKAIDYYAEAVGIEGERSPYWRKLIIAKKEQDPNLEREISDSRELAEVYLLYKSDSNAAEQDLGKAMGAIKLLMTSHMAAFSRYLESQLIDLDELNKNFDSIGVFNVLYNQIKETSSHVSKYIQTIIDEFIPGMERNRDRLLEMISILSDLYFEKLGMVVDPNIEGMCDLVISYQEKLALAIGEKKSKLTSITSEFNKQKYDLIEEFQRESVPTICTQSAIEELKTKNELVQEIARKISDPTQTIGCLGKQLEELVIETENECKRIYADFEKEKANLILRRELIQEFTEKKEQAYELLQHRQANLNADLALYQEEIATCLHRARQEFDSLEMTDDGELAIQTLVKKFDAAMDEFSIAALREKMKYQKQEHLGKLQEMQQRAERAETRLSEVNNEKYAEIRQGVREDKGEIEKLKKQLHEAQKIAAQATEHAAREIEKVRKTSAQQLEKQKQIAESLREENSELRAIVQNIPETTSIEILQKRIQQRINELKIKGITAYKEYSFNNFPPRLYNLTGLEAILLGIGFQKSSDASGSHVHYERGAESTGLSPHGSEEADKAQIQQVLNFLLSDLNSIK